MKKLMIGLLTAVTIVGMSAQAFAADDISRHKSNPANIISDTVPISNYAPKDVDINKVAICGKISKLEETEFQYIKAKLWFL
ncbi:hypothetical protein [Clostridium beijerinckii]|uniref:hypothetical protein n=1 Tax=Clostridium beijerinckii TaxID=1520 RepID=UPI001F4BF990|nr:hypothetical protein [Clostridium beijerinckii]NRT93873.1 hypothetical protein [Clostridium beijerinckii]